jgi:cellulose synthase/poly-beta-1,6-N-acetylglucosamine synthase-like glycosyltransferase
LIIPNLLAFLYILIVCLLAIYLHRIIVLSIHARLRKWDGSDVSSAGDLPLVTVQLPVYNEKVVIHRLLDAVCSLDYPHDRLQIQVLDDSTDVTTELISQRIKTWQQRGLQIEHVRRADRRGHKAGNLSNALPLAKGEFIAIFDADFVPAPAWLRNTVRHFLRPGNERLGLVQTRWSNMNANASMLTYAQNIAFDQFAIAQSTRARIGLWSSFYGSAGLWRKICIEEAGGWSSDTFSEDLDMAYRAQLCGWTIKYDAAILAAAELPPTMLAYKQQQFFWSKGNIQVSRILWDRLLNFPISLLQRLDAIMFSTWPITHLLLLLRILVQLLTLIWPVPWINLLDFAALVILSAGFIPTILDILRGRFQIPLHLSLGIGISVNVTAGLLAGLFGPIAESPRATTPRSDDTDAASRRVAVLDWITLTELVLAVLAFMGCILTFQQGRWWLMLMLINDAQGYGWVGAQSLWEALKVNSRRDTVTQ